MVCKCFFKEYLYSEFNDKGFFFNPSTSNAAYHEKIDKEELKKKVKIRREKSKPVVDDFFHSAKPIKTRF